MKFGNDLTVSMRQSGRWMRVAAAYLVLALFLGGCAHTLPTDVLNDVQTAALDSQRLLQQSNLPFSDVDQSSAVDDVQFVSLSDEMRRFVEVYAPRDKSPRRRLDGLLRAIFNNGVLGMNYDPMRTLNAEDTFLMREGNCLSFSAMFVALAREAGLRAYFNEVEIPSTWGMEAGGTQVYYLHMNVMVRLRGETLYVDLDRDNYSVDHRQHKVDDDYAAAQFFNNMAMNRLFEDDFPAALAHQRRALELQPELAFLWNNLGAIYRRAERLTDAETAYSKALSLDANNVLAMSNLSRVYQSQQRFYAAEMLSQRVVSHRMRNPYNRYRLAEKALTARRLEEARAHIKAALRINRDEHRFHFLAAKIQAAQGQLRLAEKSLQTALELAEQGEDKALYRSKLNRFASL